MRDRLKWTTNDDDDADADNTIYYDPRTITNYQPQNYKFYRTEIN